MKSFIIFAFIILIIKAAYTPTLAKRYAYHSAACYRTP